MLAKQHAPKARPTTDRGEWPAGVVPDKQGKDEIATELGPWRPWQDSNLQPAV